MMNGEGPHVGHDATGHPAAPADNFIAVDKNRVGVPGKPHAFPRRKAFEFKKKKPAQYLGFPPVGVAESYYTAAFPCQGPLKNIKESFPVLQNNPGYPVKKKKIEPSQEPAKEDNKFRNPGFRHPEVRRSFRYRYLIRPVHFRYYHS
jgi:hypothetical protein